ncbi:MAG TPA: PilZ domain-containing protein [Kofleriaceae bacterium]|nr:PilZ domain-containing protein [Kofleriaceae bacterium]
MDLAPPTTPLCELFIVLEPFRDGFAGFIRALEPLDLAAAEGPLLRSSDVFYRPDTDVALLALRFDERSTTPQKLGWLGQVAARADLPVLDPARLGHADRRAFYDDYLPTYRIRVEASAGPRDALEELARVLTLPGAPARPAAAGSQRDLTPPAGRHGMGSSPRAERRVTIPNSPRSRAKPQAVIVPDVPVPVAITASGGPSVNVRFLRGDLWVPARLRSLSLSGARLAAAAPPRLGDRVQIVLGLDRVGAVVTGQVSQVIDARDAAGTGESTGFSVSFANLDEDTRNQLVAVLRRAVDSGISLKPPPPRSAVRFPVHWPVRLGTSWGELPAAALDVSKSGLFVAPAQPIGEQEIFFQLALDQPGPALNGRARIAREVSDEMATRRGLTRGYGARIVDFCDSDSARYDGFLDRVRRRTERRLIVLAEGTRSHELSRGLGAAGYAVHSSADVRGLMARVQSDTRPPDAALIHAAVLDADPDATAALKRALHALHVPCLTVGDEPAARSRTVVDHLLEIA